MNSKQFIRFYHIAFGFGILQHSLELNFFFFVISVENAERNVSFTSHFLSSDLMKAYRHNSFQLHTQWHGKISNLKFSFPLFSVDQQFLCKIQLFSDFCNCQQRLFTLQYSVLLLLLENPRVIEWNDWGKYAARLQAEGAKIQLNVFEIVCKLKSKARKFHLLLFSSLASAALSFVGYFDDISERIVCPTEGCMNENIQLSNTHTLKHCIKRNREGMTELNWGFRIWCNK